MKINLDLLKEIYSINRLSENEAGMLSFLLNKCRFMKNVTIEIDNYKNLFLTKKTSEVKYFPCIIAHMDAVFDFTNVNREVIIDEDCAFSMDMDKNIPCGLTADDGNGIYCALKLLEIVPNLKVCFTVQEEVGGLGAIVATDNIDFFKSVNFYLQADRRGNSDIVTFSNGREIASKEFISALQPIAIKYGYKETRGVFTDVGEISYWTGVSGINISCGYYEEHTANELCVIPELKTCLSLMLDIINTLGNNPPYVLNLPKDTTHKKDRLKSYYDSPYDYANDYGMPCDYCFSFDCMNCTKTLY